MNETRLRRRRVLFALLFAALNIVVGLDSGIVASYTPFFWTVVYGAVAVLAVRFALLQTLSSLRITIAALSAAAVFRIYTFYTYVDPWALNAMAQNAIIVVLGWGLYLSMKRNGLPGRPTKTGE